MLIANAFCFLFCCRRALALADVLPRCRLSEVEMRVSDLLDEVCAPILDLLRGVETEKTLKTRCFPLF